MAAYWLIKSEPDAFSIDDLEVCPGQQTRWDGIRNYQARNFLRDQIKKGDKAFFYHSSCPKPGIAGIVEVVSGAYPDPSQLDPESDYYDPRSDSRQPRWYCVDVKLMQRFGQIITLPTIRSMPELRDMVLLRQGRLSVQPVTAAEWRAICSFGGIK